MAKTTDHEIVSIYPFNDEQVNEMMTHSMECVLMWATKDSWPVGVTHAFVWENDKIWLTFAEHRHRTAAIKRNPKVSVNVSSMGYGPGASEALPKGAITFKGTGEFHNDDETKFWFYELLANKLNPGNPDGVAYWKDFLDSPFAPYCRSHRSRKSCTTAHSLELTWREQSRKVSWVSASALTPSE